MMGPTALTILLLATPPVVTDASEVTRIRAHLDGAIEMVESRDVSSLTPIQRERRSDALRRLVEYRNAGRFPKNRDFADPTPYFVDADGTRCAMAHLIEASGEAELVADVAARRNNAYVRELKNEPAIGAWLTANGLSVEEAARIQPTYGCYAQASCLCGGFGGSTTGSILVEWTVTGTLADGVVKSVAGDVGGIVVGGRYPFSTSAPTKEDGDQVLTVFGPMQPTIPYTSFDVDENGTVGCPVNGDEVRIPVSTAMTVIGTPDCYEMLGAIDDRLTDDAHCSGCGCESTRPTAGWTGTILVAIGVLVLMRRRAARG